MKKDLTRRDFLQIGIGTGFALAMQPVTAWAILTSDSGLVAGPVEIPTHDGVKDRMLKMPAYRAMPRGKGPFPVILVAHEIFGVHEYIQDVCRRLAHQGYLAVCPNLYFRQGDPTRMKDIQKILT